MKKLIRALPCSRSPHALNHLALGGMGLLVMLSLLGCAPKPSSGLLEQIKQQSDDLPGFTVDMTRPMVEGTSVDQVRPLAEVLANRFGFRIEVSHETKNWLPQTQYVFQEFHAPSLAGITFQKDGSSVQVLAAYRKEMVIESVLPPKEGFEAMLGKDASSTERQDAIAAADALGVKNAEKTVDASIALGKEKRKEQIEAFAKAVERVCKDNGYKRAWFVSYRLRTQCPVPQESPFWELCDAYLKAKGSVSLLPNSTLIRLDQEGWVHKRGQQDLKASLVEYSVVAFEDAQGKLAKTETWKTFI